MLQELEKMFRRLTKMSLALALGKLSLLGLMVALPVLSPPVASAAETPKKVLIFSGTDPNLPTVILMNQILRSTLEKGWPGRVQFYSESLDNHRIPEDKYEQEMVKLLQRKYEGEKIDLIFTLGSPALKFLLKHQDEISSAGITKQAPQSDTGRRVRTTWQLENHQGGCAHHRGD